MHVLFRVKDVKSVYVDTTFCLPKMMSIPSRVRSYCAHANDLLLLFLLLLLFGVYKVKGNTIFFLQLPCTSSSAFGASFRNKFLEYCQEKSLQFFSFLGNLLEKNELI